MNCPKCKSKNYTFKKSKKGIVWKCDDCGYKKINKTAEQLLKEDPIEGSLKRELTKLEDKFDNRKTKINKTVTAKQAVEYLKSKTKKLDFIEKSDDYYRVEHKGEKLASIQDRKKWLSVYKITNNFKVEKAYNEKEMKEVVKDLIR